METTTFPLVLLGFIVAGMASSAEATGESWIFRDRTRIKLFALGTVLSLVVAWLTIKEDAIAMGVMYSMMAFLIGTIVGKLNPKLIGLVNR